MTLGLDGSSLQVFPQIPALESSASLSNLLQASDGTLWLTNSKTGINNNDNGSVVQLSAQDGSLLQNIKFTGANGSIPTAPLIRGADGRLYGTTSNGGTVSTGTAIGTVFSINPAH